MTTTTPDYSKMFDALQAALTRRKEENLLPEQVFDNFYLSHRDALYALLRPLDDFTTDELITAIEEQGDLTADAYYRLATLLNEDDRQDVEEDEIVVQLTGSITDGDVQEQVERLHLLHGYGLADILRQL